MTTNRAYILSITLLLGLWALMGSWAWNIPTEVVSSTSITQQVKTPKKGKLFKKRGARKRNKLDSSPPDYGDRTQLSAFLLCLLLGFTGAHHFYLQNYKAAILQLSFFILFMALMFSGLIITAIFGVLIGLTLFSWMMVDIFILIFGGLRTGKKKQLIPWGGKQIEK